MNTVTLIDIYGHRHAFQVFEVPVPVWNPIGAIYAFIDRFGHPIYIGQTSDLTSRQPGEKHDKWSRSKANGAVAVAVMVCTDPERRLKTESALIRYYHPTSNDTAA